MVANTCQGYFCCSPYVCGTGVFAYAIYRSLMLCDHRSLKFGPTVVPRPLSNDPRFVQCIYRYSRASKRFVEV